MGELDASFNWANGGREAAPQVCSLEQTSTTLKMQGRLTPKLSGGVVPKAHSNALFHNLPGPSGWHWTCLRGRPLIGLQTLFRADFSLGAAPSKSGAKGVVRFSALLGGPCDTSIGSEGIYW